MSERGLDQICEQTASELLLPVPWSNGSLIKYPLLGLGSCYRHGVRLPDLPYRIRRLSDRYRPTS
jgi:hypothetical protein